MAECVFDTRGELAGWEASAEGALALVIVLDQFPRNMFRGSPRTYAADERARWAANLALKRKRRDGFESVVTELQPHVFELEQFLILLYDRVLGLGQNLNQRILTQVFEYRDYGEPSDELGNEPALN